MRRSPVFAVAAVLTPRVGAGAISTVFTLGILYSSRSSGRSAGQVVAVQATRATDECRLGRLPDYAHFRDQTKTLQGLAAHYSTAPVS